MKILKIINFFILTIFFSHNLYANNSYFNEGIILFEKKNFEKAKFKFEQDLVYNPKSEKSYLYLSKIFNFQKKLKLEEQNLEAVILLNPKNEEALYNLAKLNLIESDYNESKRIIKQLLSFCKNYCQKSKKLKVEIDNSLKK